MDSKFFFLSQSRHAGMAPENSVSPLSVVIVRLHPVAIKDNYFSDQGPHANKATES